MDKIIIEDGFGFVAKDVMKDTNLSPQAKCIFAYLSSCADEQEEVSRIKLMVKHLNMNKDTIYKYMKELKARGYLEIIKTRKEGRFYYSIYKLTPSLK